MHKQQHGGTIVGFIIGLVVGLGIALAVAVYVTKVPVPFMNKGVIRSPGQDAQEDQKNKNWDPNAPLYGKNPAPVARPASAPAATSDTADASAAIETKPAGPKTGTATSNPSTAKTEVGKTATRSGTSDPLGDLAAARSAATSDGGAFDYFVQAGAFHSQAEADAQRAKLAMLGWEARVSEREQNGRPVFRVRVGPFAKRDDAEDLKSKLAAAGVDSALVRVQH
ncbi:SPOR domain-containing protein [Extensimonas vulgaris]|jgi:cell division protein FtsN|uniref:Cell division protein FtsN n=1 Tax=Extensimonas vulgaris TaxID=1031594 RepID=A0A369AQU5_9BURK|nr:SPOR domain-containing protein [Extensimonas vulgaris]RCX10606.1 cell division protein FtsN [Extensimonas vulgaris]TWI41248.1 cell division protein FtsN [Extensimonas vulgaris]TXD16725.1 sporulation protein [Extensimonas vulgaris]